MAVNRFRNIIEIALARKILPEHVLQFFSSLTNVVVGRNSSGIPEKWQDLGTKDIPWGTVNAKTLVLEGETLTSNAISRLSEGANKIISGKTTKKSSAPGFISITKTNAEFLANPTYFKILAKDVPLVLLINNVNVVINQDITVDVVDKASVATVSLDYNPDIMSSDEGKIRIGTIDYYDARDGSGNLFIKNATGILRQGYAIPGTRHAYYLMASGSLEILTAEYISERLLANVRKGARGVTPSTRETESERGGRGELTTNQTLRYLLTSYVFINENNPTNPIISNGNIFRSNIEPNNVLLKNNDHWFNTADQTWNNYNNSEWLVVNVIPIAEIYSDNNGVIGYRCYEFDNAYSNTNTVQLEISEDRSDFYVPIDGYISVYGKLIKIPKGFKV